MKNYLKTVVNPVFEVLVTDLLKDQPSNLLNYMAEWIEKEKKKQKQHKKKAVESGSEDDEEVEEQQLPV